MKHLLGLKALSKRQISAILDQARHFLHSTDEEKHKQILANKTIVNLFFENSTRTKTSFEIAARRLGAHAINFNIETSSTQKGETLLDTLDNLSAMGASLFVIRHETSGLPDFLSEHQRNHTPIINAGDGCHEHPSQGLLDLLIIQTYKGDFSQLKVSIVGDIIHSRVARSLIYGLRKLGTSHIWAVGPKTLLPSSLSSLGVELTYDLKQGIQDADVIVILRLQKERMATVYLPSENEYRELYGINQEKLDYAKPDVILMHPGPINRDLELSSEVADGPASLILKQVSFGIAIRMAIMTLLMNKADS